MNKKDILSTLLGSKCDNNHDLKVSKQDPYIKRHGISGFSCNICRRDVAAPEVTQGFLRCAECDYDACRRCLPDPEQPILVDKCDNGHDLKVSHKDPYKDSHGVRGFSCNICRRDVEGPEVAQGFPRCAECNYDACRSCLPQPTQDYSADSKSIQAAQ